MKIQKKWLATIGLGAGIVLAGCAPTEPVLLSIGEYELTESEFLDAMVNEPMGDGFTFGERVLETHIINEILHQEYGDHVSEDTLEEELNHLINAYGGEDDFNDYLDNSGMTKESLKNDMYYSLLFQKALEEYFPVEDEFIEAMYAEQLPLGVRVQHILVDDKELAEDIIEQLDDGADFTELVHEYSVDDASLPQDGQYTLVYGDFEPAFVDAGLELERDEYTSAPIETPHGYHIMKSVSEGTEVTIEDMREEYEDVWYAQLSQTQPDSYATILFDLLEKYEPSIQVNSDSMSDIVERLLIDWEPEPANEEAMSEDGIESFELTEEDLEGIDMSILEDETLTDDIDEASNDSAEEDVVSEEADEADDEVDEAEEITDDE